LKFAADDEHQSERHCRYHERKCYEKNTCCSNFPDLIFCGYVQAQEVKPEMKPDNEVSFNAALTSDYRYRGISQTRLQAALQGGADYVHNPSGLYAGAWFSSIKWTKDAGGGGNLEADLYAGRRGEINKDISYDIGVLTYVYPSNGLATDANTTEVYGQLTYGLHT
jgi:uncharacterized protein (TIGR02001 family)